MSVSGNGWAGDDGRGFGDTTVTPGVDGDLDWEIAGPDARDTGHDSLGGGLSGGGLSGGLRGTSAEEREGGDSADWWPEAAAARTSTPTPTPDASPARLALGVAVLAAERLRATGAGDALATGVGLIESTAAQARDLVQRVVGPPRLVAGWVASLPGAGDRLRRSRAMIDRLRADAQRRGRATIAAGRADAAALLTGGVNDGLAWAQSRAVPQLVDSLVPHLIDEVLPRLIDGSLPEIRARVLPVVIDDLTNDPQVRDLILEQGRGAVREATEHLSAAADDRVESAILRTNGS